MTSVAVSGLAFIGFGEAATAFAIGLSGAIAYDRRTDARGAPGEADDRLSTSVRAAASNAAAVRGASLVLSLVTADQALAAAEETARSIAPGALFADMNSVAPHTKRAAAAAIAAAGGRYVDVAVMAPVHPGGRRVPLLLAGPDAEAGLAALTAAGFANGRVGGPRIGDAAAVKMIRSVMVKGMEALTAECVIAADRADVLDAVLDSLEETALPADWRTRADHALDRMMVHGLRRAAEMEEAVATLDRLGCDPVMSRATIARQRAVGSLALAPPDGLGAKLAALGGVTRARAA